MTACLIRLWLGRSIKNHAAYAIGNLHALGGVSAEVIGAWVNQTERLFRLVTEKDRVGYNLAFEVNVGFSECGYVGKLHAPAFGGNSLMRKTELCRIPILKSKIVSHEKHPVFVDYKMRD